MCSRLSSHGSLPVQPYTFLLPTLSPHLKVSLWGLGCCEGRNVHRVVLFSGAGQEWGWGARGQGGRSSGRHPEPFFSPELCSGIIVLRGHLVGLDRAHRASQGAQCTTSVSIRQTV